MKKRIAKRLVALLLATAMVFTCVACGNGGDANKNTEVKVEIASAEELLTKVWTEYQETAASEDMKFMIGGGNMETAVMETPAKFDPTLEFATDALLTTYCIPEDAVAMTDDIATAINMMMANNFTAAAYHITDAANVSSVVSSIKDTTINNQWMCGMPEKLIVVTVGEDYVVSAFGNGAVIDTFKTAITTIYGEAAVVEVEENLAE